MADVDAEAGDPAVEPEAQDAVECITHFVVEPVHVRLLRMERVEIPGSVTLGPRRPAEDARSLARFVGPDVPTAFRGVGKPRMLVARVSRDEVEDDLDSAPVRGCDESIGVGQRAELGMDVAIVGHVVAPVCVR